MADAKTAILVTLDVAHEGGFQKRAKDHANWSGNKIGVGALVGTNGGITAVDLPGRDIEHLTIEDKVDYYLSSEFWNRLYNNITNQLLANKLFDLGVLFGVGTAVENLQRALGAKVDGIFGPATLLAVNDQDSISLLAEFELKMRAHAKAVAIMNPEEAENLPDWLRRIDS